MTFQILERNDVVDIISPATSSSLIEIKKIRNFVKKNGLVPRIFLEKELILLKRANHRFPSFSAKLRFEQLKEAINNSESKIIWCACGGYGSGDLLPFLENLPAPKQQKIFIGFSDISSLASFFIKRWNWQVITAPMLAQLALERVSKKSEKAILDLVFGRKKELKYRLRSVSNSVCDISKITAKVVGGCISVLAGHFGTKNQIDWRGKILFLEDEEESGERLDRYFRQIVEIIDEQKNLPAAILLGNFFSTHSKTVPSAKNIQLAIKKFAQRLEEKNLSIPIFEETSRCLGHSKNMMPLLLGAEAEIVQKKFLVQKITK